MDVQFRRKVIELLNKLIGTFSGGTLHLSVKLTDGGTDPDKVRIGDGTTTAGVIATVASLKEDISSVGGEVVVAHDGAGAAVTKVVPIGGKYKAADQTLTEDDVAMLRFNSTGNARIDGRDALVLMQGTHTSPKNGSVTYKTAYTLDCAGFPFDIDDNNCFILGLFYKGTNTSGKWRKIVNGVNGVDLSATSNVITITGGDVSPFAAGDIYRLVVDGPVNALDAGNDAYKVSEISPLNFYRIPGEILVDPATPQDVTNAWATLGGIADIDMRGLKSIFVFFTLDINSSLNFRIRALGAYTDGLASAAKYPLPIKSISGTDILLSPEYMEFATAADQLMVIEVVTNNGFDYVELQMMAGTVGATAGQCDACYITRVWN